MKTLEEMRELHKQQKLKLLTLDQIPSLIGKKICTIYFGYAGQDHVDEFVVKGLADGLHGAKQKQHGDRQHRHRTA